MSRLPVRDRDSDLALAFTPDGKSLISLGHSGVFRIEEITSGVELLHREFPRDGTGSLVPLAGRQARGDLDRRQYPEALPVGLAGQPTSLGR